MQAHAANAMTKVQQLMAREVVMIDSNQTVLDAASLMSEKGFGCLLVVDKRSAKGIITERDLVRRVMARGLDPSKVMVAEVMSTPLVTVSPDATVNDAARLMSEHKIRRLPVVLEGTLVGLVTATDIANHLAESQSFADPVLNALARRPPSIHPGPYG